MSVVSKQTLEVISADTKEELIWKLFDMGLIDMTDVVTLEEYAEDEDEDDFTGILNYLGYEVEEQNGKWGKPHFHLKINNKSRKASIQTSSLKGV